MMKRYFIELSYLGTHYHGWQIQPNAMTVQEKINEALEILFKKPQMISGCGRTDTGVHAKEFFAHIDLDMSEVKFPLDQLAYKLNSISHMISQSIEYSKWTVPLMPDLMPAAEPMNMMFLQKKIPLGRI